MKLLILAILSTLALAQGTLPACAQTCALNAIGSSGCAVTDAHCLCTSPQYLSSFNSCVGSSCNAADQAAATTYGLQYCASAGVTIAASTPAPTATGTASSASAATTTSGSAAMSSSMAGASSAASATATASSGSSSRGTTTSSAAPSASSFKGAGTRNYWSDAMLGLPAIAVGLLEW